MARAKWINCMVIGVLCISVTGCGCNSGRSTDRDAPRSDTSAEHWQPVQWTLKIFIAKATTYAKENGYDLGDYESPEVVLSSDDPRCKVSFAHRDSAPPGTDFTVWIDIASGNMQIVKQE